MKSKKRVIHKDKKDTDVDRKIIEEITDVQWSDKEAKEAIENLFKEKR